MEDIKGHIWNIRFKIGWFILPGSHKHVSVYEDDAECAQEGQCAQRSELRSLLERARKLA